MMAVSTKWWPPESLTKFGWSVNVRSIHEAECSIQCVGSFISWCSPWNEDSASSSVPSVDILSSSHQAGDRASRSP